ncbi:hypothetical protein M3Y99_00078300 [Aphelenchoides fujianensis]|nr:hypothetical protein M3Y99_00078300 [Aphelenchoides fujianensis]
MRSARWTAWALAAAFLSVLSTSAEAEESSIWPRLRSPTANRKSNKPKKYKCILVDDDESDEVGGLAANGASYVSELQQRRVQAAAAARTTAETNWPQQPAAPVRPQAARTLPYEQVESETLDRCWALKQITSLNRPAVAPARPQWSAESANFKPPPPPAAPITAVPPAGMKLDDTIKQYAALYQVTDVLSWVHKNCAFAKMYLPNATCEEIDQLVASCYRH